jgi:hypothetical protein
MSIKELAVFGKVGGRDGRRHEIAATVAASTTAVLGRSWQ